MIERLFIRGEKDQKITNSMTEFSNASFDDQGLINENSNKT
jgi:hypothetical protein